MRVSKRLILTNYARASGPVQFIAYIAPQEFPRNLLHAVTRLRDAEARSEAHVEIKEADVN